MIEQGPQMTPARYIPLSEELVFDIANHTLTDADRLSLSPFVGSELGASGVHAVQDSLTRIVGKALSDPAGVVVIDDVTHRRVVGLERSAKGVLVHVYDRKTTHEAEKHTIALTNPIPVVTAQLGQAGEFALSVVASEKEKRKGFSFSSPAGSTFSLFVGKLAQANRINEAGTHGIVTRNTVSHKRDEAAYEAVEGLIKETRRGEAEHGGSKYYELSKVGDVLYYKCIQAKIIDVELAPAVDHFYPLIIKRAGELLIAQRGE